MYISNHLKHGYSVILLLSIEIFHRLNVMSKAKSIMILMYYYEHNYSRCTHRSAYVFLTLCVIITFLSVQMYMCM